MAVKRKKIGGGGAVGTGLFLVGNVIGAGFASGKELMSFFGGFGWAVVPIACLCGACFVYGFGLFMRLGQKIRPEKVEDINAALFGKFAFFADIIILLNFVIGMAAMLSASNSLFRVTFGKSPAVPWFSFLTAAVVFACVYSGLKGVIKINVVVMPVLIVFLSAVSVISIVRGGIGGLPSGSAALGIWAALTYAGMNFMQSFPVMSRAAIGLDKKTVNRGSAIGGALLTGIIILLVFGVYAGGEGAAGSEMPSIYLAAQGGGAWGYVCAAAVWAALTISLLGSVFTLSEWLESLIKSKWLSITLVLILGLTVSMLGFEFIVKIFFPLQGAYGLVYIAFAIRYDIKHRTIKPKRARAREKKRAASAALIS